MTTFRKGQTIYRYGSGYRIVRSSVRREFVLECLKTGSRTTHGEDVLVKEQVAGALTHAGAARRRLLASVLLGIAHEPMGVPRTRRWSEEVRRLRFMQQLIAKRSFDKPWKALSFDVWVVAELAGETIPHASTVRRWRALYRAAQRFASTVLGDAAATNRTAHRAVKSPDSKPVLRVVRREV